MKTLATLAAELERGATTSRALTEAALDKIEAHQQGGGAAFISIDRKAALAAADAADCARAAGFVASPIAGLPISIKDLFDIAGQVTRSGSRALDGAAPAAYDAPAVARLRRAGAVIVGRTNMSEFAFSGLGVNPHYGTPRSPFDAERVAGGSTSGGALSVALGMAAATLGTDTGGSIRIPASFCGLTGFKPTARRVPLAGAVPLSTTLDSAGPLAPSLACCATLDAILSGAALDSRAADIAGLRLAVIDAYVMDTLDAAVAAAFDAALAKFSRAGAALVRVEFPELRELPAINEKGGFAAAEAWHWHRVLLASRGADYDPIVAKRIARGQTQQATDYLDLLAARSRLMAAAARRLRDVDGWLMPSVATLAPRLADIGSEASFLAANGLVLRNTSVINFLDGCAVSLPCGPGIGISVCGLAGADARVLQVAGALEATLAA